MSQTPTTAEVAETFRLLADLLAVRGDSIHRINAYRHAAESIDQLWEPLDQIRRRGELQAIPGVGREIAQKISDLLDTGTFPLLDELTAAYPAGVAELLRIPGVGPKRARALYDTLGIDGIEALRAALAAGRLDTAAGLGAGFAKRTAAALADLPEVDTRIPLGVAYRRGQDLVQQIIAAAPPVVHIELVGSIRRFRETIGDIDIAAVADDPTGVVDEFLALPAVAAIEMQGPHRGRVRLQSGISADLWVLPPQHWGALLVHTTGDKYHNIALRDLALERGFKLNEYGITCGETLFPCATEAEVYAAFGMDVPPVPVRNNTGEIELALQHALPALVTVADLRGDLHTHSTWSDGHATISEMAHAALERGYAYLAVTDHSHSLGVAGGLDAERLRAQRREIEQVNAELAPFRVLAGVEVEVRTDGSLDLDDEILASLDIVVASVHSGLRQGRDAVTQRALAAIRHPLVDILAHPTGRIVGGRAGGDFDMDALFAASSSNGTVLEINSDPARLDLRDSHARAAIAAGCTLSIDSDAHATAGLDNVFFGVGTAQRAWVEPRHVLNTLPLDALLARLKRNRIG